MPTSEGQVAGAERPFGYAEALEEVTEQLRADELARVEAERAGWRARRGRHSVLIDERGLALA